MRNIHIVLVGILAVISLTAADFRNLLLNSKFCKPSPDGFPLYWMIRDHSDGVSEAFEHGGPDDMPFIRLRCQRAATHLCQNNIHLVPGEKYVFSAWMRSKNLTGKHSGILITPGSGKEFLTPPPNQDEWRFVEKTFVFNGDEQTRHDFCLQIDDECGQLDVACVALRATTEAGDKGARNQREQMTPSMVPLTLLRFIPRNNPHLDLFWVGPFPGEPECLVCSFTCPGKTGTLVMDFSREKMRVSLAHFSKLEGEQKLFLKIRNEKTRKILYEQEYTIRFVDIPQPDKNAKVLNNLVTLLHNGQLAAGEEFRVVNHRLGWVYFCYKTADGETANLSLDGQALTALQGPANYAIRYLEPGIYILKNNGTPVNGETKLIPNIHLFPLVNTAIPAHNCYDWNFAKNYMLPALTTVNGIGILPEVKQEMTQIGLRVLANGSILNPEKKNDETDIITRLEAVKELKSDLYEETTLDDLECWNAPAINPYVYALKHFANPTNKLLASWIIGPTTPAYCNFISTACNVSSGHGRILYKI